MRLAAIVALVLFPLAATPQTPGPAPAEAAPASTAPSPRWSVGAGVLSGSTAYFAPSLVYLGGYSPPTVPGVTASVERRISERTWLVLGAIGSLSRTRQDVLPGSTGISRNDLAQLAVTGGARWVVTPARSPVALSVLALADAGLLDARVDRFEYDYVAPGPVRMTYDQAGWDVGASLGLALERELTGGLALRLATPLVRASYTATRTRVAGQKLDATDLAATVALAPSLELRLAF